MPQPGYVYLKDASGKRFCWSFWRDYKTGYWILSDHADYERTLEKTWAESVPRIRAIAANHGLTCEVS